MDALMVDSFLDMDGQGTTLPEVVCNLTFHFRCNNGACVNATVLCDGYIDCLDGTDEDGCSAPVRRRLTPLEVAAIVLGCIIGTVIVCCLLGTIIDCFMHVYKYWCSCLHKAYKCPSEMIALRTQNNNPSDPTVLVVRAIPPSYSTIIVSCEPSSQVSRSRDNQTQSTDEASGSATCSSSGTAIIPTMDLIPPNSPIRKNLMTDLIPPISPIRNNLSPGTDETTPLLQHQAVSETSTTTDELVCTKDMSTQTSSSSAGSIDSPPIAQIPLALSSANSRSTPCIFRMRMPPSYSSIFNAAPTATEITDRISQSQGVFHSNATNNNDQSQSNFLGPLGDVNVQTTNAEVHASRTPTELADMSVPDDVNNSELNDRHQANGYGFMNGFMKSRKT